MTLRIDSHGMLDIFLNITYLPGERVTQNDHLSCFRPVLTYKHIELLYTVAWSYAIPSMPNSDARNLVPRPSSSPLPSQGSATTVSYRNTQK